MKVSDCFKYLGYGAIAALLLGGGGTIAIGGALHKVWIIGLGGASFLAGGSALVGVVAKACGVFNCCKPKHSTAVYEIPSATFEANGAVAAYEILV
jgi:hypothetical protein